MIQYAEDYFNHNFKEILDTGINLKRIQVGLKPIYIENVDTDKAVKPFINHSRWIAECPYCNNAEMIFKDAPGFLCRTCWNGGTDKFIPVEYPEAKEEIETILSKRTMSTSRNWLWHETIEDLEKENQEHGIG